MALVAAAWVLVGVLLVIAGLAWLLGPVTLLAGGGVVLLVGLFGIDVSHKDGK